LNREQIPVARCTVERLMGELGVQGAVPGKVSRTTLPDKEQAYYQHWEESATVA